MSIRWIPLLLPLLLAAQPKKIVMTAGSAQNWAVNEDALRQYRSAAPGARIVVVQPQDLAREIEDADAVIGSLTPDLFAKARKLKWVQTYSAGVEAFAFKAFVDSDVTLTNCKIVQGPNIADHAMAMLLAFTRGMNRYIPGRLKEEWNREDPGLLELNGMTAVVIGVGGIGSQIAVRANAFGMRVIGVDPKDLPHMPFLARTVTPDRLDEVLPEADVVFVSAPLTAESKGMMGRRQFELMKSNGYFIAVSRGELYDTPALVQALDSKKLAGAGLDVTVPEPLPKGHALWKFENVIVTPHVATHSPKSRSRRVNVIKENIARFAKGEKLINIVEKQRGY
ncbi:MAG: D-2-hydroxyacid dehydrogenase [Acidobacteria bacterium]|nr:D-2-hydroxyacid dehydrogenase [Acidobacteriota bacterium]